MRSRATDRLHRGHRARALASVVVAASLGLLVGIPAAWGQGAILPPDAATAPEAGPRDGGSLRPLPVPDQLASSIAPLVPGDHVVSAPPSGCDVETGCGGSGALAGLLLVAAVVLVSRRRPSDSMPRVPSLETKDPNARRHPMTEEHRQLDAQVVPIARLVAAPPRRPADARERKAWARDLASALEGLARALTLHFEREEQGGFLADVVERHPNLSRSVAALRDEHIVIRTELAELVALLASGETPPEVVRAKTTQTLRRLANHELAEDDVFQEDYFDRRQHYAGEANHQNGRS
ncbi:MAG: hemerythrin domain-containing protein [Deltaproteobacteria bacterium]|nr:hemerythrin domain-containing protein [Deltaproteobacteria bacterium]